MAIRADEGNPGKYVEPMNRQHMSGGLQFMTMAYNSRP